MMPAPGHDPADPDLLLRIPCTTRHLLLVGCGGLGAEHRRRNPATRITALEPGPAAAARPWLDAAHVADLAAAPAPFAPNTPAFDCIVYDCAALGAADPWALLRAHLPHLSADGTVLLRLPNAEHWRVLERTLRGLPDAGAPAFSAATIRAELRRAGLVPVDCAPQAEDGGEAFLAAMAPALRGLGIDADAFRRRATAARHVWRARRRPVTDRITIVSTMLNPVGGVSEVRVAEPVRALAADPGIATAIVANNEGPPPGIDGPRIFIFHRPLLAGAHGLARVAALIREGWLVLCEFDDHPDYIPVLQRPDIQNFRAVHAVQTSTAPLAEVLGRINPEIAVFGNAVARLPEPRNFARADRLSMLFAGLNREGEWPRYIDALNAVVARAGARLHIEVINDRAFFDALRTPHKTFTPLCDYGLYLEILGRCEISFMPLSDTPFNRCKSDLKFIEAAAARVAALASDVVYQDSIADGHTGILFRTPAELEQRLSRLVANPEIARGIGEAARAQVSAHRMLADQIAARAAWYRGLWARREDLHRALLARVPELAALAPTLGQPWGG